MEPTGALALGLDVGGTRIRSMHGRSAHDREFGVDIPVPSDLESFVDAIGRIADAAGGAVGSIAMGLPGRTGSSIVDWVPALPFLDGVDLGALLASRTGAAVALMNDAQLSLLAEVREGAAVGASDVVLVAIGTGIGGAVMIDGRIRPGATGTLGAFGWLSVPDPGPSDPQHGAWERTGSGSALSRAAGGHEAAVALMAQARATGTLPDLLVDYARRLGHGFAAVASVLDPEVVLVAGGVSEDIDVLHDTIREVMRAEASPTGREVPIRKGALGSRAGVIGAFHRALEGEAS